MRQLSRGNRRLNAWKDTRRRFWQANSPELEFCLAESCVESDTADDQRWRVRAERLFVLAKMQMQTHPKSQRMWR